MDTMRDEVGAAGRATTRSASLGVKQDNTPVFLPKRHRSAYRTYRRMARTSTSVGELAAQKSRNKHPMSVDILAYGSLIADPGIEIRPLIQAHIPTTTPFPVEFARWS